MTNQEVYFGAYNAAISGLMSCQGNVVHHAMGNLRHGEMAMDTQTLNAISALAQQIAFKAVEVKLDLSK